MLVLTMLPIVLLSKKMAKVVDHGQRALGAPTALSGFLVAILVLSPEAMAAVKAAMANQLQRTVNIALGSALATIGLTIPAVLMIGFLTGKTVELGLENVELVLSGDPSRQHGEFRERSDQYHAGSGASPALLRLRGPHFR